MEDTAQACRLLLHVDHSLDIVELIGRQGAVEGVSSAITALAGYSPGELVGNHYRDLIHPDDRAAAEAAFAEALSRGHAGPLTLRYRCKDGSWRTVQAAARNYLKDPHVGAILVITRDITEQLQVQSMLAEANVRLRGLSQQLTVAREEERARIARELHDDVGQILVGLSLNMAAERDRFRSSGLAAPFEVWTQLVGETLRHLRQAILDLRPPVLDQHGLAGELRSYIDRLRSVLNVEVDLDIDPDLGRFPLDVEMAAFRIIQQALTNAIEHSQARHLFVALHVDGQALRIQVRDDGRGFDPTAATDTSERDRIGLLSMRERAEQIGGRVDVISAPGSGTEIHVSLPLTGG